MTRRPRRNHSPAFKAKVALAAIRGEQTLVELSQQFTIHRLHQLVHVSNWRKTMVKYVVSLGAWCQTTFQIKNHGLPLLPSCFDWLVTPWSGMLKIIETNGSDFGVECYLNNNANSVQCSIYGVLYHHEFPRKNGIPEFNEKLIKNVQKKMIHKYKSMDQHLKQENESIVLFVRYGGFAQPPMAWPYLPDPEPINENHLNHLLSIIKKNYPNIKPLLIYAWPENFTLTNIDKSRLDPDIYVNSIPLSDNEKDITWRGEGKYWTLLFNNAFKYWNINKIVYEKNIDVNQMKSDKYIYSILKIKKNINCAFAKYREILYRR